MELQTRDLVKSYRRRRVVDRVSLALGQGEIVGLLGPNGAGKTTTFYMVVGLVRPEAGAVFLHGQEVTRLPMYRRARAGIGYLPQEPSAFRRLTVEENLRLVLQLAHVPRKEAEARIERLLAEFSLAHLRRQRGGVLSGGERRRLEIARALCTEPSFILLDEPFTGIDPIEVGVIQQLVRHLKSRGIGVLITDHNVRETLATTDHAYIISEGRIVASGTSAAIAADPVARQHYFGENFRL
ncbi:MAG: LPS export ABC transporter ATP-binding protein [Armatimonadetes bacterium]|nr:LPS export ABC transporter ATP-binding protein [Armatimonadota bacterium]